MTYTHIFKTVETLFKTVLLVNKVGPWSVCFIQFDLFALIPLQSPKETSSSPELTEQKNMEEDSAFDKSETNGWREDAVLLEIISKRC